MSGFNFGTGASSGGFSFGTPKTSAPPASSGFSFGASAAPSSGGFSFGGATQTPVQTPAQNSAPPAGQPTGLFSFATPAASAAPATGFSFGAQATSTPAPATGGLSFGTAAPKVNTGSMTQPATGGFSLNSTSQPSQPSGGFSFGGAPTQTQPSASTGVGFLTGQSGTTASSTFGQATAAAAPTGLTFGTPVPTSAAPVPTSSQPAPTFSLGQTTAPPMNFGLLATSSSTPSASSLPAYSQPAGSALGAALNFGAKPTDASSALASTGSTVVSTTPSLTSILGTSGSSLFSSVASSATSATATTATTGLTLGSSGTGLGFGLKTPASSAAPVGTMSTSLGGKPLAGVSAVGIQSVGVGLTVPSAASVPPAMTYAQLENLINKWSLELEDQEKHFLQQATQVNAWDRMLIHNGERITTLHREMEKVKMDQKRLDQELDFILSQQKELEDLLSPLEESVKEQSGTIYAQHADEEREKTYKLAENIDAQLKRMAQDLKEVIEHLNTSAGPSDTSNPLQQICKILNAHMDSLQWIDQNSALLQRKVEQVSKECESRRKEHDRGFPITFE
ncbi:nucleoporin-62 C-terminal-like protein [Bombina bombina]|uniref:nucleoporin-62 C-terminal-like protein n=1 Tax=Bombina bombina TaxID=8345 RepID=UPI00235AE43C|nr:nucleoporin-62 C-terminal-like protein [Bombina bombina]